MIHTIRLRNFNGFKEEANINFVVNNRASKGPKYAETNTGERVSKVNVIVGPNSSGKTTILRSLAIIRWLLCDSVRNQQRVDAVIQPFVTQKKVPTLLAVTFGIDDELYTYSVEVLGIRIISEVLEVKRKNQVRQTTKKLFSRSWDSKAEKYIFKYSSSTFSPPFEKMNKVMLEDVSMNALAKLCGDEISKKITRYWENVVTNIEVFERFNFTMYGMEAQAALNRISKSEKRADAFFDSMRNYNQNLTRYDPETHKVEFTSKEGKYALDISQLSSGTTQLVVIKDRLEDALRTGGVALIDEFDAYLHPVWLADLISQFMDPSINKKNAQLITSTHNPQVLNLLDHYQIFVTDLDDGHAEVSRLDEIKGVRADDNFFANYMSGRYRGIPEVL